MPKVLLVEDDPAQLEIFATELSDHAPELTVLTALSAEHALRILNSEEVNVLVTDLRMPGMDGIELLAQVSRIDPDIASLALSGALTKEMTSDLVRIGVDHVLAKPLPPGMLAEEVRRAVKGATLGFVRGFSLPTLLQLIQLERKTCTLDVRSNGRAGFLYFREGELFDAEVDGKVGREAAETVVCWPSPHVEIHRHCAKTERRISERTDELLLQAWAKWDEGRRHDARAAEEPVGEGEKKEYPMTRVETVLTAFREQVPEFVSTDLVNLESGLSIGGTSADPAFDASAASASFGEVVRANTRALQLLGMDGLSAEDILITTNRVNILLRLLGSNYYLCLAIGKKGSLGFARAVMKKYEAAFLAALGEVDASV